MQVSVKNLRRDQPQSVVETAQLKLPVLMKPSHNTANC